MVFSPLDYLAVLNLEYDNYEFLRSASPTQSITEQLFTYPVVAVTCEESSFKRMFP